MFKIIRVIKLSTSPKAPMRNTYQSFVVSMPDKLMPILQQRIFTVLLQRYKDVQQLHDLTAPELLDLDTALTQYTDIESHNMVLNGREWSLLKRFLTAERVFLSESRVPITMVENTEYWTWLSEFLLSVLRPTQVVNLSFFSK